MRKSDIFGSYTNRQELERLKYLIGVLPAQLGAYERALAGEQNEASPEGQALVQTLTEMATNSLFAPKMLRSPAIVDKMLKLCSTSMRAKILGLSKNTQNEENTDKLFRAVFTNDPVIFRGTATEALTEVLNSGRILRNLDLDLATISVMNAQSIAAAIASNSSIEKLHLSFMALTHALGWLQIQAKALAYRAFANILPTSSIKQIAVTNCPFGSEGVKAVALALRNNQSARSFYVGGGFLHESDIAGIAAMIDANPNITSLTIQGTTIIAKQTSFKEMKRKFAEGIVPFNMVVDALSRNTSITQFNAERSHITETQQASIDSYLMRNRELVSAEALSSSASTSSLPSSGSSTPSISRWFGGLTRRWGSSSSTASGSATPASKTEFLSPDSATDLGSSPKGSTSPLPPRRSPNANPPQ